MAVVDFYVAEKRVLKEDELGRFFERTADFNVSDVENIHAAKHALEYGCDSVVINREDGKQNLRVSSAFNNFFKVLTQSGVKSAFDWYVKNIFSVQYVGEDASVHACLKILKNIYGLCAGVADDVEKIKIDVNTTGEYPYCFGFYTDEKRLEDICSGKFEGRETFAQDFTVEKMKLPGWGYYVNDLPVSIICEDVLPEFCRHLADIEEKHEIPECFNLDITSYKIAGLG